MYFEFCLEEMGIALTALDPAEGEGAVGGGGVGARIVGVLKYRFGS